ncbi:ROK family protein [Streptomyces armeniacus]|uniref:ROK family protein n=1 Tax=Streptomyces armeniacus TaxID=83291 RepID=A0A345Y0Q8_9ACTN|nr:ROK family protein [Streptomyces armeniacus]
MAVGIDIGGTKTAGALVDLAALRAGAAGADGVRAAGAVLRQARTPTPVGEGPDALLDAAAELVARLLEGTPRDRVRGVGVGTGGVVDSTTGTVLSATSVLPGWAGTEVAAGLGARCGLPVRADGDGNTTLLGEHAAGAARGASSVLLAAVGTGIGGALMTGGTLVRGARHAAGHLGHVAAPDAAGVPCSCGARGHVEAVSCGPAIVRRYTEATGTAVPGGLRELAARTGTDPGAARAVADGGRSLGVALAGLVNTFDPELVVIGGGVADIGAPFTDPLEEGLRGGLLPAVRTVRLARAALGSDASVLGAATLAG